jgi:hypothetical protein
MPEAFTGTPTVSIGSGKALRTIQWGNNVFAAANFDVTGTQSVTLPDGAWYDYLGGAGSASGTYTLAPGELKVFTGRQVMAPTFTDIQKRDHTGIESVDSQPSVSARKIFRDGQVLIIRGDKTYTLTGQPLL